MPSLWKLLTPTFVVETVKDDNLHPDALRARGIRAIITDLDNTLVPWRHYDIAPNVVEWLAQLEVAGIKICIASNTIHTERLKQSHRRDTAVFGDQIFTDVLAGNRLTLTTILLRPPLSQEEFISTQFVRYIENFVIRRLRTRGQWPVADRIEAALEAMPDPRRRDVQGWSRVVSFVALAAFVAGLIALVRWRRR
jgi:predicted HAD superfamily phosphohydrolase YqeG